MVTKIGEIARGEIYQGFQLINYENHHILAKSRHFRTPQKSLKLPLFVVEQNLRIFHHLHLEIATLVKKISIILKHPRALRIMTLKIRLNIGP